MHVCGTTPLIFAEPIHKFIKLLKDSQADEASSVTLLCETAQTPSSVTWFKGHAELRNGGRYEMSQKEQVMTLTIRQLEEEDTDTYTCDVATARSTAKVTVNGKDTWIYCIIVCVSGFPPKIFSTPVAENTQLEKKKLHHQTANDTDLHLKVFSSFQIILCSDLCCCMSAQRLFVSIVTNLNALF